MILQIIEILFPVFIISFLGFIYARTNPNLNIDIVNKINLDIFIPILIFYSIAQKLPNISVLGYFSLGAVIIVLGSGLIAYPILKLLKIKTNSFLPPMMFNNSINLGLPLALLSFGEEAMAMFIALSLVQVIGQFSIAVAMYGGNFNILYLLKNPVIIATILGLLCNYFNVSFPDVGVTSFELLAGVSIPMILFSLGFRLSSVKLDNIKLGLIGAILCPLTGLITAFIAIGLFDYTPLQEKLLILFGLLPPAVINAILAEKYKNDSSVVASIVAFGNILTVFYFPVALYFLL